MTSTTMPARQPGIWWLFVLYGVAAIVLGLLLLSDPAETLLAVATFLGFYWAITGVLSLVRMFVDPAVPWIWSLLIGVIGVLAGILVLRHPMLAALTLPTVIVIVLGVEGFAMGVLDIVAGFQGGGLASFLIGAINVLIALLLLGSPVMASLAVPLVFGVLLLIKGVGVLFLALRHRAA